MHYLDFARARSAWIAIQQTTTLGMPIFDKMREFQPEEVRALIRAAGDIAMNVKILGMALTETDGSKHAPPRPTASPRSAIWSTPARRTPTPRRPTPIGSLCGPRADGTYPRSAELFLTLAPDRLSR
jgi:hypothetical protein